MLSFHSAATDSIPNRICWTFRLGFLVAASAFILCIGTARSEDATLEDVKKSIRNGLANKSAFKSFDFKYKESRGRTDGREANDRIPKLTGGAIADGRLAVDAGMLYWRIEPRESKANPKEGVKDQQGLIRTTGLIPNLTVMYNGPVGLDIVHEAMQGSLREAKHGMHPVADPFTFFFFSRGPEYYSALCDKVLTDPKSKSSVRKERQDGDELLFWNFDEEVDKSESRKRSIHFNLSKGCIIVRDRVEIAKTGLVIEDRKVLAIREFDRKWFPWTQVLISSPNKQQASDFRCAVYEAISFDPTKPNVAPDFKAPAGMMFIYETEARRGKVVLKQDETLNWNSIESLLDRALKPK